MGSPLVLLVADDPPIARSVVYAPERDGLAVTHCLQLLDALSTASCRRFCRSCTTPLTSISMSIRSTTTTETETGLAFTFCAFLIDDMSKTKRGVGKLCGANISCMASVKRVRSAVPHADVPSPPFFEPHSHLAQ